MRGLKYPSLGSKPVWQGVSSVLSERWGVIAKVCLKKATETIYDDSLGRFSTAKPQIQKN